MYGFRVWSLTVGRCRGAALVYQTVYLPFRYYLSLAAVKVSGSAKRSGYGWINMLFCDHILVLPFDE